MDAELYRAKEDLQSVKWRLRESTTDPRVTERWAEMIEGIIEEITAELERTAAPS